MADDIMTEKRIGILMGGTSSEREVSLRSGEAVYQSLKELGYNAAAIDVGEDIVEVLKKEKIEIAFLALHGGTGENGSMQGLLEVLGISYTGSGIIASALAMDKEASKKIFSHHGINVAPYMIISKKGPAGSGMKCEEGTDITGAYVFPEFPFPSFDLPWVVKPSAEGSSVGVNIVKDRSELNSCVEEAFKYGERVIVEKFIKGREVHVGILGDRALGGVEVRPSLEFYNYEAKYTSGMTDYILPPEIESDVYEDLKKLALKAHYSIRCAGATRVDFILDDDNRAFILEVNTLPGMTRTSLLPKIAEYTGLDFKGLTEEILRLAVEK